MTKGIDIGGSLVKIAYSSSFQIKTAQLSEVYKLQHFKMNRVVQIVLIIFLKQFNEID